MNIKAFIKNYEDTLKGNIAKILDLKTDMISAKWDDQTPTVKINMNSGHNITTYSFEFDKTNQNLTFDGYAIEYSGDNNVTGIKVRPVGLDLYTFAAIRDEFAKMEVEDDTIAQTNEGVAIEEVEEDNEVEEEA